MESIKPEIHVYNVVVQEKDGTRIALTKFELCGDAFLAARQMTQGLSAAQSFHGYAFKSTETSEGGILFTVYSVPFSEIRRLVHSERSEGRTNDLWMLYSKQNAVLKISTSAGDELAFCGETPAGEKHVATAGEITEISFE